MKKREDTPDVDPVRDVIASLTEEASPLVEPPKGKGAPPPDMTDPAWNDFVLSHFTKEETDDDGHPYVAGLRRVARLLLGPIVASNSHIISPARLECGVIQPVTAEHTLKIYWEREGAPYYAEFSDCADVSVDNCDPKFAIFPAAVAATRAEARCLRKALGLRSVAAEEKSGLPSRLPIRQQQIVFIDTLCRKTDIDVMKFIAASKGKYKDIEDVPYETALKMLEALSAYQNKPDSIPPQLKGYKSTWRAS